MERDFKIRKSIDKVCIVDQVFLYVTSRCNLNCKTCYAQDLHGTITKEDAMKILKRNRELGAWKVTFIGGEPTIYDGLEDLISLAKDIGYSFVRINTNGMFPKTFFNLPGIENLDVICFSVDGPTPRINDYIRQGANLNVILENMRYACKLGYEVRVNTTVTSLNIKDISKIIHLVRENGASEINLNVIIKMGRAFDNSYLIIEPQKWMSVYMDIMGKFSDFNIRIKVPPAFSRREDLEIHTQCGHKCVALDGSRQYVVHDGTIYPCILFLGRNKPINLRTFGRFMGDQSYCKFLSSPDAHYLPLCIFYKKRLNYDNKGTVIRDTLPLEVGLN